MSLKKESYLIDLEKFIEPDLTKNILPQPNYHPLISS